LDQSAQQSRGGEHAGGCRRACGTGEQCGGDGGRSPDPGQGDVYRTRASHLRPSQDYWHATWLTDKTLDYHETASWNSRVRQRRGCFWCWILEAMAGTGSASADKCKPVTSS